MIRACVWLGLVAGAAALWFGVRSGALVLPWQDATVGRSAKAQAGGPIVSRPGEFASRLRKDRWLHTAPLGSSTVGRLLLRQTRFSFEGAGAIERRTISADTESAAALVGGRSEKRTGRFLHGLQQLMHERNAYVHGISLARSDDGYRANYLMAYVNLGFVDYFARTDAQRRQVLTALMPEAYEYSYNALASHMFATHWIDLEPGLSKVVLDALAQPAAADPERTLMAAAVIRHELEHSVTAYDSSFDNEAQDRKLRWFEEGTADTLANWPGEAARTAKALGLPYPKSAERRSWMEQFPGRAGYPEYVHALRTLLGLAGIDVRDPHEFGAASRLLQSSDVSDTPSKLADAIAEEHAVPDRRLGWLTQQIEQIDGSPQRARRLDAAVRGL